MKFFSISVLCLALLSVVFAENFYTGTWSSSQYWTGEMPDIPVQGSSIRQVLRVSIPGEVLRFHFSNIVGKAPLEIKAVHVAKSAGQGTGKIVLDTDTPITFNGKPDVTIPAGGDLVSDDIPFHLEALEELAITIFYGSIPQDLFTSHAGARTNSYIETGNNVSKETFSQNGKFPRWYTIAAIDVVDNEKKYAAVLCYGDSITDGRGSTTDKQNRWTDILAEKLQSNPKTQHLAVLNQGIGGSSLYGQNSIRWPTGLGRFQKDVAEQVNVKYMIVLYGVNDITNGINSQTLINAFKELIKKARDLGIIVYGSPILPFKGSQNWNQNFNRVKEEVNNWIINTPASQGGFDAVVDMASPVADPRDNQVLLRELSDGDGLHPNHLGYEKMGNAIPFELFIDPNAEVVEPTPTEVVVEPTPNVPENPQLRIKCLAEFIGYPCCAEGNTEVLYQDENGDWGYDPATNNWCGITPFGEQPQPQACWSEKLGYPCCSSSCTVYFTDSDGQWGIENYDWCGIPATCN